MFTGRKVNTILPMSPGSAVDLTEFWATTRTSVVVAGSVVDAEMVELMTGSVWVPAKLSTRLVATTHNAPEYVPSGNKKEASTVADNGPVADAPWV